MGKAQHHVVINVTIDKDEKDGTYSWGYQSDYKGFDPKTGKITLQNTGETDITYVLGGEEYNLIFVNMDPTVCATRQFHTISVNASQNSITISDTNDLGDTGTDPISLRLIARLAGQVGSPIISPDPEVQNDPNERWP